MSQAQSSYDIVCFSHLRWNFVYQRPQHLMGRAAQRHRVVFVEEPIFGSESEPRLETYRDGGVHVATPHLPAGLGEDRVGSSLHALVKDFLEELGVHDFVLWLYSPMFLPYLRGLEPKATVYDCMDELANFRFAPPVLREREQQLFRWADVVFTGGQSLYEAKRRQHPNCHCFPSAVDVAHFAQARHPLPEPPDLVPLGRPRVGFYGVIDERMDTGLLEAVARRLPGCEFVMVGPFAKVDPAEMPRLANLHFLGMKSYAELPYYLAHWDVAMLPFALNDSTRFISPTKTPEYLAAGKPVVSTPIRDVVRPYGEKDLVYIADDAEGFAEAIRRALLEDHTHRQRRADAFLAAMSWDHTWTKMEQLIEEALERKQLADLPKASPIPQRTAQAPVGISLTAETLLSPHTGARKP
ncbi:MULTISPECIES: glycosyltransferase family 1 protein [unclassified Meiothermus]|uniref:glycosyltransferase family 1 protein n=1 Tax=unclassified Meiothermus TaxID=370471 RepID=UPI000D7C6D46|nr:MULTISPECIES: glycosyltransferase family 1 protein [unclassified Meiothermus]PZA08868.1 glycosyltransferase family 1 protein [Meiothermus sp. Pnk-1]RYM33735.1 glycosyltransferase family 1 protein [Meiothermus sp. PNK-Is4]